MEPWRYASEYGTTGEGLYENIASIENTVDAIHNDVANRDAIVAFTTNGVHGPPGRHTLKVMGLISGK